MRFIQSVLEHVWKPVGAKSIEFFTLFHVIEYKEV